MCIKQQILARMWRKGNLHALLVGMQTGAATVENNTEFPLTIKNGILVKKRNSYLGIIILSEISQSDKDKYRMISLICGI